MADTMVPTIVEMARTRGAPVDEEPKTVLAALRLLDEVAGTRKTDERKEG